MAFLPFLYSAIAASAPTLLDKLFGKGKDKIKQAPRFTAGQNDLINQILGGIKGPLASGFQNLQGLLSNDPQAFKDFEAPSMRQFNEQTVPGLAERFSGLGAGSQSSSAFQQALGQAGAGLSENLASLRGGLQQNALQSLLGFTNAGLTNTFENYGQRGTPGIGTQTAPFFGEAASGLFNYGLQQRMNKQNMTDLQSILGPNSSSSLSTQRGGFPNF